MYALRGTAACNVCHLNQDEREVTRDDIVVLEIGLYMDYDLHNCCHVPLLREMDNRIGRGHSEAGEGSEWQRTKCAEIIS